MVSKRRSSQNDIRRRGPRREPRRRILIVCEGKETEPSYFRAFRHATRNPLVHVEIARQTGVPFTVVSCAIEKRAAAQEEAKQQHDANLRWDEVWAVFDVDEHPRLVEARELARNNDIRLAVSNPCFELWLLLHFQDQRAHIERHKARAALKLHLSDYDKTLEACHFSKMHEGYANALERASSLDKEASLHGQPGRNPSSDVPHLTESIRAEARV